MNDIGFILASASPRRRELLAGIGVKFEVVESDFDESTVSPNPQNPSLYVEELALLKANSVAGKLKKGVKKIIIAADTVVCFNGSILEKPKSKTDAFEMLSQLSGNTHEVHTGVCVYNLETGESHSQDTVTKVTFKQLSEERIKAYIATGEPMDKAGAYGLQGLGALLVEKIDGDYFNVVGLPLSKLAEMLEENFNILLF